MVESVVFAESSLPTCPFLWSYNEYMFPLIETAILSEKSFKFGDILKKIISVYETDYYLIKQKMFKESLCAYVAFHSWYYSKTTRFRDMTKSQIKAPIFTGLFTDKKIKQDRKNGISINCLERRSLHIHNKRLSPSNTNTFTLDLSSSEFKDLKEFSFVSVVVCDKLKKCCVTRHILEFE